MSDVDDELLALAGGDVSSGEDEEDMDMSRDGSRSPSPSPAPASAKKDVGSSRRTATPKASRRDSRSDAGDQEEGEASSPPASPSSQMSAPMDESDSDSDAPQGKGSAGLDDDVNLYPIEGTYKSLEEKAEMMKMVEVERERIIAERREETERNRQNRMLRQLKVNQDKDSKKRKANAADLDDAQRKASRPRTKAGELSDKMDTLRRAREERSSRKEQRERENDRRRQRSPSYPHSPGRDQGSDIEWDERPKGSRYKSRTPEGRDQLPADLRDVERLRVGRSRFAEYCHYPGFEKAIEGCFVRINIGPDPETRQDVYRMAIITGFNQGRPYAVHDSQGQQAVVDLYVKAAHGNAQREWPFIMCSDKPFTENEWNRYKQVCLTEGVPLPIKAKLAAKIDDINRLIKYPWTEEELSEKIKRQNALRAKYSGVERETLTRKIEQARERGDEETVTRLQEKLDSLEVPRLAFRTSLAPAKKAENKGMSQQEKLALLNAENRRKNAESVRKAQLMERARAKEIEMRLIRGEAIEGDNSRRLRTRMKFVHDANDNEENGDKKQNGAGGSSASGTSTPSGSASKAVPAHIAKLQELQREQSKGGIPVIHKPLTDDDIIGSIDLDLDIEI